VDEIPADGVTVTIIREGNPLEMFKALKTLGGMIEEKYHGIYYIKGITVFDTQVIVTKELDKNPHSSLRVLTEKADEDDVRLFLESTGDIEIPGDKDNVEAVLQASISANKEVYDKVREVIKMSDVVREFFQPAFDKAVEEEVEEEVEERLEEKVEEKVKESTVEFIKAIMDSDNIGVDEAMNKLKISENDRDVLKQKIAVAM
jgi:predicted house-cleaning noncanonical NTP pyrophosphatase (MazG superfamily)